MYKMTRKAFALAIAKLAITLVVVGSIPVTATPALGQGPPHPCHPRDYLLAALEEKYGEVPIGFGVTNGRLIELLTSEDGTSWTIIQTSPNGISCMITSGEGWWAPPPRSPKEPAV